jgi:hypothetical protein
MTIRRVFTLLALLVGVAASAAETAPPNPPVSDPPPVADPAPPEASKPVADASKTPPPKPMPESKGEKTKDGDFKPSEEISEDMAVAYPVDI